MTAIPKRDRICLRSFQTKILGRRRKPGTLLTSTNQNLQIENKLWPIRINH